MYIVQRESGNPTVKTLHGNMLLPFSAIPGISEIRPTPSVTQPPKQKIINSAPKPSLPVSESDSNSDSDGSTYVPRYIPPHRRNKLRKVDSPLNGSANRSPVLINDSTHQELSVNVDRTPSVAVDQADSTGIIQTGSLGSEGRQSSVDSTRNQSEQS